MKNSHTVKIVTMRDVGLALGVSHSTVSLALRNHKSIPRHRCLLIQAKAEEMGYTRNAAATMMARFRADSRERPINSTIAWLNFWDPAERLRSFKEFDCYWRGAVQCAEKLGYQIEEFICNKDHLTQERLQDVLLQRGIEGILIPPQQRIDRIDSFPWEKFSAVRFGRSLIAPQLHVVTAHQVQDAMLAYRKIKELGYNRIGYVTGYAIRRGHQFQGGYTMIQQIEGEADPLPVLSSDESMDQNAYQEKLEHWLKKVRPDAIISDEPDLPERVRRAGYRVPEDIAVAALSILDCNSDSGINQNSLKIGRAGVLSLIAMLHDGERGIPSTMNEILIHGEWVQGSMVPDRTCGDPGKPGKKMACAE